MSQRSSTIPSSTTVACPECGTDLGEALIRQLSQPQVEIAKAELAQALNEQAEARVATQIAALQASLTQQQQLRTEAESATARLTSESVAIRAEAEKSLSEAKKLELDVYAEKRKIASERADWDLREAQLRDEISVQERADAENRMQDLRRLDQETATRKHQTELQLAREVAQTQHQATIDALESDARRLRAQAADVAKANADLEKMLLARAEAKVSDQLSALNEQLRDQQRTQQTSQIASQNKLAELTTELTEAKKRSEESEEAERRMRVEQRKFDDERASWDLQKERMRDDIAVDERRKAEQGFKSRLELHAERTRQKHLVQMEDLKNINRGLAERVEELHRQTSIGPRPQQEGVVRQQLFAEELMAAWPDDDISVVARGQRGADVVQVVRDRGRDCGTIVWECKWTKQFNPKWVTKLAADAEHHRAKVAVLVSATPPANTDGPIWVDGILVCDFTTATHAAGPFRKLVITEKQFALANSAREGKADKVYDYITTGGFAACLVRIVKATQSGIQEMEKVRNSLTRIWANWERHQHDVIDTVFKVIGELESAGTKMPAPLRAELPSAERLALTTTSG